MKIRREQNGGQREEASLKKKPHEEIIEQNRAEYVKKWDRAKKVVKQAKKTTSENFRKKVKEGYTIGKGNFGTGLKD